MFVNCERGCNVGFVDHEIDINELTDTNEEDLRSKKILNCVLDEDQTIRNLLRNKISAENYALAQCKMHIKGRKLAIYSDIISTEFQFDRKKLTIYIKKYQEISVCRLVRNLYDTFKIRIKVLEVEDVNVLYDIAHKYHELSKLNLPFSDFFHFDLKESIGPLFLRPEHQQPPQPKPRQREQTKSTKNPSRTHGDFESPYRSLVTPSMMSQPYSLHHFPPPPLPVAPPPMSFPHGYQVPIGYLSNPSADFADHKPISAMTISPRLQSRPFLSWNEISDDRCAISGDSFARNLSSGPVDELYSPEYSFFSAPDSHHLPTPQATVPSTEHSTESLSSSFSNLNFFTQQSFSQDLSPSPRQALPLNCLDSTTCDSMKWAKIV